MSVVSEVRSYLLLHTKRLKGQFVSDANGLALVASSVTPERGQHHHVSSVLRALQRTEAPFPGKLPDLAGVLIATVAIVIAIAIAAAATCCCT
eukprot:CAMPEP_0171663910 /NCGR_PEP_ID=MMETSP0990-20121206/46461_1 /TAXON_ID=483369 /ORGANISM="non described non described, Strain CCMP2098" /LENGTH=92 /DNA_ID=CAMNT_0012246671 /DNA_START=72 /DNA_END=346 /DNA_ORIENTATION=+